MPFGSITILFVPTLSSILMPAVMVIVWPASTVMFRPTSVGIPVDLPVLVVQEVELQIFLRVAAQISEPFLSSKTHSL